MKKILIILFAASAIWLTGCQKQSLKTPDFDVTVSKTTFKVGEAVQFAFSGNPETISFFSGEIGKNYANINRLTATGTTKLQFTSVRANGTQANSLALMVSTDFAGVAVGDTVTTTANIGKATWTDITSRATLSSGASTASGVVDLTDFATAGKPVYLAFKYTAASGSIQNKWTISALTLTNTLPDASLYTIGNLTATAITNYGNVSVFSPGWVSYKVSNSYSWVVTSGTSLVITGAATAATATANAEAWTFMGPVVLNRVSPDLGVALQNVAAKIQTYNYTYNTAGTYTVTFVGGANQVSGQKSVVKQLQITVTP